MEFFQHHIAESIFILRHAILHLVDEWKFGIELSNFLVITNRQLEAFLFCKNLLKGQIGAGRLWTLFIHIVHEYRIDFAVIRRMFGPEKALRYFRIALHYVAKSGELWCEGARIFLDPTSPHFSLQNARIALNYAVIFTPRYGDTFIEVSVRSSVDPQGIRLLMLSSDVFLTFHDCSSNMLALLLQTIPCLMPYLHRCALYIPNYGPLWYRCCSDRLAPSMEVLVSASFLCAQAIARDANIYFSAIKDLAERRPNRSRLYRSRFAFAFLSDFDFVKSCQSFSLGRRTKSLFDTLPFNNS